MAENQDFKGVVQTFSGLNVVAGLWLVVAPWLLGYVEVAPAFWNDVLVGAAVVVLAGVRMIRPARMVSLSWINLVLGAWLILSPFVLRYGDGSVFDQVAFWNDLVLGFVVVGLAWLSIDSTRRMYVT
ncbi:SPW repeat protein [Gilvimarinus sp. F26214L]|uniref:SPW repeat protein n=1 Tax=Gilvimarinus sp. DZF01 TaxID=3461371 RepID=UPI0040456128